MNRFFKAVGILSVVLFVFGAISIGALVVRVSALTRESRVYVDAAIPAITSTWNKNELMDRASPELVKMVAGTQLDTLFARCGQLGSIVSFEPPKGQARAFYSPERSTEVASYVSDAKFQNGTARVRMELSKQDGHWMIQGFFLDAVKVSAPSRA